MGSSTTQRPPRTAWPLGTWSLGAKLVLFSILFTIGAVATTFLALSIEIRRHSRSLLAETLAQHQSLILHLQQENLAQVVRSSRLMTSSPTLRAAMETYRSEAATRRRRPDLLATIRSETDKIAIGLGRGLLVVTDQDGRVLTSSGRYRDWPTPEEDLSTREIVRRALVGDDPAVERNQGILTFRGDPFQVGCVPIVLQGFVIGTLILGEPVDQAYVERLRETFKGEIVITVGGRVAGSTLDAAGDGDAADQRRGASPPLAASQPTQPSPSRDPDKLSGALSGLLPVEARGLAPSASVLNIDGEEFVAAPLRLGEDEQGQPVDLYLFHSLTRTLASSTRSLGWTLLLHGALAIVMSGFAAWSLTRTLLRPLDRFVRFMRSVTETGDHAHRFDNAGASLEVKVLSETYNGLMDSLSDHEQRLHLAAQEEMSRLDRLKESEKLAALGRMLSGAAHEINNPLSGVVGNVELLMREQGIGEAPRRRLEQVHRESQRIAALVRNLLRIAHKDVGPRMVIDVNRAIRDTVALRLHDFAGAGMRIDLDLSSERVRAFGNELELQQVFLNVINNAFDALKDTKADPTLTIHTRGGEDWVLVSFLDNGPGIAHPERVFEHFYTTKDVGKGTGLGLSISYAIVRDHGGRIEAANHAKGGARFTIELPAVTRREDEATAPAAAEQGVAERVAPPPPALRSLPISILVVDDEPSVLDIQTSILDMCGASVVAAGTGAEAIEHLRQRTFDVVVTDLKMPGAVSGADLYRWAKDNRPETADHFVFVTGDTAGEDALSFLGQSTPRYVLKPFSLEEYVSKIEEAFHASPSLV